MDDTYRLIVAHGTTVMANPSQLYIAVLPVIPQYCALTRRYPREDNQLQVRVGRDCDWPGQFATRMGHTDRVRSVAFSMDGLRVVSGSNDRTIRIWDAATGDCTAVLKGHTGDVGSVAFSVDGMRVVSGSDDRRARIWDAATGNCTGVLEGHTHWVRSVAFSVDGLRVVSGSHDQTGRMWDVATGDCTAVLKGHTGTVTTVAFSADGLQVVSGSRDGTVRMWDATADVCTAVFEGHTTWITSVAFSVDGTQVTSSDSSGHTQIWSTRARNGPDNSTNSVALNPTQPPAILSLPPGATPNQSKTLKLTIFRCNTYLFVQREHRIQGYHFDL